MKRKLLFTSLLIPLLLSACSAPASGGGNDPVGPAVPEGTDEYGYQWSNLDAPIINEKNAISFKVIAPKNPMAMDYKDMKVMKDLNDSTNVKIDWTNLSPDAWEAQKTTTMANQSKYPDAIYNAGFNANDLLSYGAQRHYLVAIDRYLEFMPNLKRILESRPDIKAALTTTDGHIYSLPRVEEMGLKEYPNILFLNKAWVKKLIDGNMINFISNSDLKDGLKLTRQQFKTILTLFRNNDMNGNGNSSDEIPLSFVYDNWQGNQADFFSSFGFPDNIDHKTIMNGQIISTLRNPKFKDALNEFANWYKTGLIDQGVLEDKQDTFLSKGKDSQGVPLLGSFYWWELETVVSPNRYDEYITVQPLTDSEGHQYVGKANNLEIEKGVCVVFEKCKRKDILLTYFDRYYSPYTSAQINYGPIGIVYEEELDESGRLVNKPIPPELTADELRLRNAPLGCIYLTDNEWEHYVKMEPRAELRLDRLDKYVKPHSVAGNQSIPNINYTREELNQLSNKERNVSIIIGSNMTRWILAGSVSDAEWNQFQTSLTQAGLDDILRINQTGYERYLEASQNNE